MTKSEVKRFTSGHTPGWYQYKFSFLSSSPVLFHLSHTVSFEVGKLNKHRKRQIIQNGTFQSQPRIGQLPPCVQVSRASVSLQIWNRTLAPCDVRGRDIFPAVSNGPEIIDPPLCSVLKFLPCLLFLPGCPTQYPKEISFSEEDLFLEQRKTVTSPLAQWFPWGETRAWITLSSRFSLVLESRVRHRLNVAQEQKGIVQRKLNVIEAADVNTKPRVCVPLRQVPVWPSPEALVLTW